MLIVDRLVRDGRYEEARRWLHHIFDPTTDDPAAAPARFWRLLPFRHNTALERAQDLMELLVYNGTDKAVLARRAAVVAQLQELAEHPFEPHRIARLRLVAYQKFVVMSYLDVLLAQADALFRRDTIESNNEAAQLYLLALEILGRRASRVPPPGKVLALSYDELPKPLGPFSNAAVEFENVVPPFELVAPANTDAAAASLPSPGETLYFGTPENEKLRGYWDQVEDRLFKLRNCLNIEGVFRQLALFEPPIDPAALVRAVAAGLDLGRAVGDLYAPPSRFRFAFLLGKASELCADLRSLGAMLLAALEKGDAEELANLRTTHEVALLKSVRAVKEQQLAEARHAHAALQATEETTKRRRDFYAKFDHRITQERNHLERLEKAETRQEESHLAEVAVAAASAVPNITTGASGSFGGPVATITIGGHLAVAAAQSAARVFGWMSTYETYKARRAELQAGWARRFADVKLQEELADKELVQIGKQLLGTQTRITIAETDLANHDQQVEQSTAVSDFLRGKFSNTELYRWLVEQVSTVYHQAYKLTFDLAKRAERAYRFERGIDTSSIVQYGWEGARKGLLAAERLSHDLKRLEAAWLDAPVPPYELTRHVSVVLQTRPR